MKHKTPRYTGFGLGVLVLGAGLMGIPQRAGALPSFARKYRTSCQTCHVAYPKLTPFGEAFRRNNYHFPQGRDEDYVKAEDVPLGSEGYKKVWPNAVWPGSMPGLPAISAVAITRAEASIETGSSPSAPSTRIALGGVPGGSLTFGGSTLAEDLAKAAASVHVQAVIADFTYEALPTLPAGYGYSLFLDGSLPRLLPADGGPPQARLLLARPAPPRGSGTYREPSNLNLTGHTRAVLTIQSDAGTGLGAPVALMGEADAHEAQASGGHGH